MDNWYNSICQVCNTNYKRTKIHPFIINLEESSEETELETGKILNRISDRLFLIFNLERNEIMLIDTGLK